MSDHTITALYTSRDQAERAKEQLKATGLSDARIDIHDRSGSSSTSTGEGRGGDFLSKVKDFFGGHEDHHAYSEGVRRGNVLLTAQVDDDEADAACQVLESSGAMDIDAAQQEWRGSGWTGGASSMEGAAQPSMTQAPSSEPNEQAIPIVEERLKVGKREVERGGVRVRSYVVETPVEEQVALREERVSVERRPVGQPTANPDALFEERNIELTETAEEAVVAKDAVVREELIVRKDTDERVETVEDTVRRTEVEVDDRTGRSATRPGAKPPA